MYAIWLWHQNNPGQVDVLPFDLVHTECGNILSATYCCRACHEPAAMETLDVQRSEPPQFDLGPRPRQSRRNDGAFVAAHADSDLLIAAAVIGDIPCNEILYELFQGPCHLLALSRRLQIGQHVIRDRLDKLLALGMIEQIPEGRRTNYRTLPKCDPFLPLILSIAEWGDRWCNSDKPPPETRVHSCGQLLEGRLRCDECGNLVTHPTIKVVPRNAPPETPDEEHVHAS